MEQWNIGLSSWIIADGNYRNFERWQLADFALEFSPQNVEPTQQTKKAIQHIRDNHYQAVAQVVFSSEEAWVIDFGLCAFNESKTPSILKKGDFIEIDLYLAIDPFFYFERLYKLPAYASSHLLMANRKNYSPNNSLY